MDNLVDILYQFDALRDGDQITERVLPKIAPKFDQNNTVEQLHPLLHSALRSLGINNLYQHQADAIEAALRGDDVVLVAPTAGGKTLSFLIPLFNLLLENLHYRALMLHPMKALSNDQRRQLSDLSRNIEYYPIESWTYDGDTDQEHRKLLRESPPHILFTNPEMLHYSFLA